MTVPPDINDTIPGGVPGGVNEAVKTAMVYALREALLETSIQDSSAKISSIDLEYPLKEAKYPGIWVQFSITKLVRAGIGMEGMHKNTDEEGWVNWEPIREWFYEGRITLTVLAMTNRERDRISDLLISMLAFSRPPAGVVTNPARDTGQYRALTTSLSENPYVSVGINSDLLVTGGQATEVGTPWAPNVLTYTDSYSFDVLGQFNLIFSNDGTYTLRAVATSPEYWDPNEWH